MQEINLSSGTYLLVEVPEDASDFMIDETETLSYLHYLDWVDVKLPVGFWEIVGRASILSEHQWDAIVDSESHVKFFMQNSCEEFLMVTARNSGYYLIESKGMKPEQCVLLKKIS